MKFFCRIRIGIIIRMVNPCQSNEGIFNFFSCRIACYVQCCLWWINFIFLITFLLISKSVNHSHGSDFTLVEFVDENRTLLVTILFKFNKFIIFSFKFSPISKYYDDSSQWWQMSHSPLYYRVSVRDWFETKKKRNGK